MVLDRYDRAILAELQRDGRISNVQLAGLVSLSESACLRRVRALEQAGLIERYVALLDQKEAGLSGTVFVHIALRREEQSELAAFEAAVQSIPEVMECYLMTGDSDYLLRVVVEVLGLPPKDRFDSQEFLKVNRILGPVPEPHEIPALVRTAKPPQ